MRIFGKELFTKQETKIPHKEEQNSSGSYIISSHLIYKSNIIMPLLALKNIDNINEIDEVSNSELEYNTIIILISIEYDKNNIYNKAIIDQYFDIINSTNTCIFKSYIYMDKEYNCIDLIISGSVADYKELIRNIDKENKVLQSIEYSLFKETYKIFYKEFLDYNIIREDYFVDDNIKFELERENSCYMREYLDNNPEPIYIIDKYQDIHLSLMKNCPNTYKYITEKDIMQICGIIMYSSPKLSYYDLLKLCNREDTNLKYSILSFVSIHKVEYGFPNLENDITIPYYKQQENLTYDNIDEVIE